MELSYEQRKEKALAELWERSNEVERIIMTQGNTPWFQQEIRTARENLVKEIQEKYDVELSFWDIQNNCAL